VGGAVGPGCLGLGGQGGKGLRRKGASDYLFLQKMFWFER